MKAIIETEEQEIRNALVAYGFNSKSFTIRVLPGQPKQEQGERSCKNCKWNNRECISKEKVLCNAWQPIVNMSKIEITPEGE